MRHFFLYFSLFISYYSFSQDYNLPYRIGNQFGVSNPKGQMIIKAQFDMIKPIFSRDNKQQDSFFVAHKINDSINITSFIINENIVLKDNNYSDYFVDNQLIYTIEYLATEAKDKYGYTFTERNYLYTYEGKSLFKESYKHLSTINIIDGNYKGEEVLIFTKNLQDNYALHLYNKTAQKITKTFFENSNYIKHSDYDNYDEKSFIYRDSEGQTRKLYLKLTKDFKVVIKSNNPIKIRERQDYDDFYDSVEVPTMEEEEPAFQLNLKDSISLQLKKVEIESYSYLLPKRKETLVYGIKTLDRSSSYAVIKNNKIGIKKGRDNSILLPIEYDDIYYGNFRGINNGLILKKNNTYGLYIFAYPKSKFIAPVFKKIPMLGSMNYPNHGDILIKLFDENGDFFCYANQDGILYYSE